MNKHTADLLQQHFDTAFSAPDGIKKLRELILTLAMQGKLVQQDPNDPPASKLLKEIEAEKKRLVKEGKIKAPKPLPPVMEEEKRYDLPRGWEWVQVANLTDVGTGSTPETTNVDYYGGYIPWYTSSATNNLFATMPDKFITEKAIKETNCKVFPAGSLMVAMYGQGKTRGQISEIVTPGATNQAVAVMVFYASSEGVRKYLKYFFMKIYDEIRLLAEGAAQPNLNVGKIKETLIPLPPLSEQHRIVAKIDQLMVLCDTLDQQIDAATAKRIELLDAVMGSVG
jgi:type I restriction enzyme S subunit